MGRFKNLTQLLEDRVASRPEAPFLVFEGETTTYRAFLERTQQAADSLLACGLRRGDRVALLLENCAEALELWFGAARLGAVHVPLNPRLRGEPLAHQLRDCQARLLVIEEGLLDDARLAAPGLVSPERTRVVRCRDGELDDRFRDLPDGRGQARVATSPINAKARPGDPLVIMYTSGTTGPAKGAVNSHGVYLRIAKDLCEAMALEEDDRMYVFLPLCHANPQMMGVMPALWAGATIVLSRRFSARRFWSEVREGGATVFTHIGSPLPILLKQPERADDADNPIRLILGGVPRRVAAKFGRRFDCSFLDGWGMVETGCTTTISRQPVPPGADASRSSNGFARDCFEVAIADESGDLVPVGREGEIVVRPLEAQVMFSGYHNRPEITAARWQDGWFRSGDHGRLNADGALQFLGRSEDAIRRGGENISASDIEGVLLAHPKIAEAAVVGVADEVVGQEVKACVVSADTALLSPGEVRSWCERLPDYMVPRYVEFYDEFEKTASEKVIRGKLGATDNAWDAKAEGRRAEEKELT